MRSEAYSIDQEATKVFLSYNAFLTNAQANGYWERKRCRNRVNAIPRKSHSPSKLFNDLINNLSK